MPKNIHRNLPSAKSRTSNSKGFEKGKNLHTVFILILVIVISICFYPILKNNFINWDDDFYVINNALLRGPDWKGIFTQGILSNYHPFTILTLAFNYAISGTTAWSYLLFNLILHIVNVLLVFKFINLISGKKTNVAFLTALLFAIHPMHVESVAWVSERKDVLYTFFFLISLIQYWKFLQTKKRKFFWYCFLFFIFSLLSKPAAIILPFALFLLDYWHIRVFNKKIFIEKIPFLLLAILFAIITIKLQSVTAIKGLDSVSLWTRFLYACYSLMVYFFRFFIPYPLSGFHPFPSANNLGIAVYLSPLFVLGLAITTWFLRKTRFFVFGVLFFVTNLILVIQLITIGSVIIAERYTYVSYIGLAFIVGMWMDDIELKKQFRWSIPIIICLVFGYMTFQRTQIWKNSFVFWTDSIDRFPTASSPRYHRAFFLSQTAGSETNPNLKNELLQKALEDCNVALQSKDDSVATLLVRQNIYIEIKRNEEAFSDALALINLAPGNYIPYYTMGIVYTRRNEPDSALEAFKNSISLMPDNAELWNTTGNLLMRKFNHFQEALTYFNHAIGLNPSGQYYANRSLCYYNMGEIDKAKTDALTAIEKGINMPDNYRKALNIE